jgi:transcriptional regulator with XRE-family HTH domain
MKYKIPEFLDMFLRQTGINTMDLAKKLGMSQPYISYVKNGKKTASINFIKNLLSAYPFLEEERENLLNMLENDKKIEKLKKIEKKKKEVLTSVEILDNSKVKLTTSEKRQLNEVIESASYFFNDENISEEDKEQVLLTLHELFFESKKKNKSKKR